MYGLDNNCPTKKHTNPYFVKQAFTTKILVFYSTDNLLIIINIRRNRLKSLLNPKNHLLGDMEFSISNSDPISPANIGRCLRIYSTTVLLRSDRSYKKDHTTCITD